MRTRGCANEAEGCGQHRRGTAVHPQGGIFSRADVKLPEGRYFVQDIVGCTVKDADTGVEYGVITAVGASGSH